MLLMLPPAELGNAIRPRPFAHNHQPTARHRKTGGVHRCAACTIDKPHLDNDSLPLAAGPRHACCGTALPRNNTVMTTRAGQGQGMGEGQGQGQQGQGQHQARITE